MKRLECFCRARIPDYCYQAITLTTEIGQQEFLLTEAVLRDATIRRDNLAGFEAINNSLTESNRSPFQAEPTQIHNAMSTPRSTPCGASSRRA